MSSDFPLSKVEKFLFFLLLSQQFVAPIPEKGISDSIVQGSMIRVFTVREERVVNRVARLEIIAPRCGGVYKQTEAELSFFPLARTY